MNALRVIVRADPDDAVTFIDSLKEDRRERVISLLDPERRDEVRELINYPEGTVGRIMNTDLLALAAGMLIGGAALLGEAIRSWDWCSPAR